MKKILGIIMISLMVLAGCGSSDFKAQTNWEIEEFEFDNQRGEETSLEDLKGTVWLATFIFTNCETICPPMTFNLAEIQGMLKDKGIEDYKIVGFSVDPEVDTPEVLQEYLDMFEVPDQSNWELLTGYSQEYISQFAEQSFKALVRNNPNDDQVIHGSRFYLIDQNGVAVKNYTGFEDVPKEEIVIDMETLIEEGK
ncbi:SCO family protein [Psychrobacillus sp. BL-248-WT-3]|uniref:SCO family protein n=1 Tax=Psychrobacillus sp. BL-248-WT-3 TaxID=2725306 RepID=UPI00146E2D50|nr:SCO family protein [Psychrobacillus sp. BL-248-WT-3]NME05451.1 SCO family protein [Psychrobacillus sp. BL-248-WT-3]